jgi:RNA polymerase sigma factor (sigma-70 family)
VAVDKLDDGYRFAQWLETLLPLEKARRCIKSGHQQLLEADICQEFANVLESMKAQGKTISPQYALGVLRNIVRKSLKKEIRERQKMASYAAKTLVGPSDCDCQSPPNSLIAEEYRNLLHQAISRLSVEEHLIVASRFEHDLTFATIAKILDYKSDGTIRLKYSKIIDKLSGWMKIRLDD